MLFGRRKKPTLPERLRIGLWPRVSWRRSAAYYVKRVRRLSGTPSAVAMGTAVGAFVAFTPFIGFHILIALALAWPLRANLIAAALGTWVGNPLTFPFIWAATYELGHVILRGFRGEAPAPLKGPSTYMSLGEIMPYIEPMAVGSLPLGLVASGIVYVLAYKAVAAYRETRREHLSGRRRADPPSV